MAKDYLNIIDKMGRGEQVSLEIIDRICTYFSCDVKEILEHIQGETK